jgi:hypothetical protein
MKRKRNASLDAVTRRVADVNNDQVIDELYGLEPVYRPDDVADQAEPTKFVTVHCPYCAEQYETQVDLTAGSFTYVEDCQICCQPIELYVEVNDKGRLRAVNAQRMD